MSIELFIYLASVAGDIKKVIVVAAVIFFMCVAGYGLYVVIDDCYESERKKEMVNTCNKLAIATFVLALVSALLPSERTMYMMAGAHIGKEAIQSETASKIHKIIDKKLDEYMLQLEGDKK